MAILEAETCSEIIHAIVYLGVMGLSPFVSTGGNIVSGDNFGLYVLVHWRRLSASLMHMATIRVVVMVVKYWW